jgi:protein-S-isoprenylcysteine O-methyltransferase Ste14
MFPLLFALLFVLWGTAEVINHLVGKGWRVGEGRAEDRGSYGLLIAAAFGAIVLAFGDRFIGVGLFPGWVQYTGLGLMAAGVVLRQWAVLLLGRHYSVVVAIEDDHQLVASGPYRWLRHPSYTGGLLAVVGLHLAIGSWWTLVVAAAALMPAFVYRIQVEERALLAAFGEEYRAYRQRTWRLLPGW